MSSGNASQITSQTRRVAFAGRDRPSFLSEFSLLSSSSLKFVSNEMVLHFEWNHPELPHLTGLSKAWPSRGTALPPGAASTSVTSPKTSCLRSPGSPMASTRTFLTENVASFAEVLRKFFDSEKTLSTARFTTFTSTRLPEALQWASLQRGGQVEDPGPWHCERWLGDWDHHQAKAWLENQSHPQGLLRRLVGRRLHLEGRALGQPGSCRMNKSIPRQRRHSSRSEATHPCRQAGSRRRADPR
jgi:hypothetical protein